MHAEVVSTADDDSGEMVVVVVGGVGLVMAVKRVK